MKDELSRRQMLSRIAGTLGALLAVPIVVSCAESGSSDGDLTVTSSSDNSHTHRFTITAEELATPTTISSRATTAGGAGPHTHTLSLTATQVNTIAAGGTVTKSNNPDATGDDHVFTFKLA